jgi:hypothetical protein
MDRSSSQPIVAAAAIAAFALAAVSVLPVSAAAQSFNRGQDEVRCDVGSDHCVVLHCLGADFPCAVTRRFDRDKTGAWMKPYGFRDARAAERGDRWTWYGDLHVSCNPDGSHCRELPY